jgi:hypothetical protein
MKLHPLRTATAVALFLAATAAYAQQKPDDGKAGAPPAQAQQNEQGAPKGEAPITQKKAAEPKDKGTKGTAQGQSKEQPGKGTAQTEPKAKAYKGTAQTEHQDKASKGSWFCPPPYS